MSPETLRRLRALELQLAALAEQVAALVSEAEHQEQVERAGPALVTPAEPKPEQFYGGWAPSVPPPSKPDTEMESSDAATQPRRARRSP